MTDIAKVDEIHEIKTEALRNLERADSFHAMFNELREREGSRQGRNSITTSDALRAAIVFQHATIEDFLRLHFRRLIIEGQIVSLIGNVTLDEMIDYYAQVPEPNSNTVNMNHLDYARLQSAELFLRKTTFTNAKRICTATESITGLRGAKLTKDSLLRNSTFEILGEQAIRRNQIVHRCDRNHEYLGEGHTGKGKSRIRPLREPTVIKYREATELFVNAITKILIRQQIKPSNNG